MNNQRRKLLNKYADDARELSANIQAVLDEEQEAFDNMPESLQESERGEQSQNAIGTLENSVSLLDEVTSELEEATE